LVNEPALLPVFVLAWLEEYGGRRGEVIDSPPQAVFAC
jgi:hypothetical protein